MFHEHVPRGAQTDEDAPGVAVCEEVFGGVEDAPAGDHVVFVGVVLDVWDTGRGHGGGVREEGGSVGGRIVEVGGCGAKGVDFLRGQGGQHEESVSRTRWDSGSTYQLPHHLSTQFSQEIIHHHAHDEAALAMSDQHHLLHLIIHQMVLHDFACDSHIHGVVRDTALQQALQEIRDEPIALVMDAEDPAAEEDGEAVDVLLEAGRAGADTIDENPALAGILLR